MESTSDQYKKSKERWFLDRFLGKLGLSLDVPVKNRERPDFTIQIDGKRIGLEVTEFFFPDEEGGVRKYFQILREKAIAKAWRIYSERGGRALCVTAAFQDFPKPLGPSDKREVNGLAHKFEKVVRSQESSLEGSNPRWVNGWPEIPELDYFSIRACPEGVVDGYWGREGPTHQEVLEAHHIQSELDGKAGKYPSYVSDHDEVWLLIFTEGALMGVPHEIGTEAKCAVYDFPFDRAYWFDSFPNVKLTRLKKA